MKTEMDFGIPLPDGTRLSARVWIPDSAELEPVPSILEYLPYRKSDGTIDRDETMHPWFAEHGYACLRVDRRGCGESEGLYDDEYSEQELSDGEEIIKWIAAQPWCNGNVGIQGISWGGFNGLQIAARRPEALKAVISIGTTVDRFADDIHFKGGVQLSENIGWIGTSSSWFSVPPDPAQRADWREVWLERLEKAPFLAEPWIGHSDRDAYWAHGSVCETYDAFDAAILVIGGQQDGYRNAMAAMLKNASGVVQGIMGPWGHKYPHISPINPAIDYLNIAKRWWDRWLKGEENGAEEDPAYCAYVMDSVAPGSNVTDRPGRWLAFREWPAPECEDQVLPLGDGVLGQKDTFLAEIETDLRVGRSSGEFFPYGLGPEELPGDQTEDDARSLTWDGALLEADLDLVGAPRLRVTVASDKPCAQMIARLCDVRPDGTVALICLGVLNLRHRDGFEQKVDLTPGERYDVTLTLDQCAYRVPKGHSLRLSISGSYWPFCWPEGEAFTLTVSDGDLSIPVVKGDVEEMQFDRPAPIVTRPIEQLRESTERKTWETESDGQMVMTLVSDHGQKRDLGTGLITESRLEERWSIHPDDPASAEVEIRWTRGLGRGNWGVKTEIITRMKGERDAFDIEQDVTAWDGGEQVFEQSRSTRIPR